MTIGLTLLAASRAEKVNKKEKHLESITAFRGILMVLTVFSILAVDFQVFPRRFAKTELYGTSLMDIGVGIFVFMQGIVHGLGNRLRVIRWSLFLMGCTRLLLMSLTDYPSHVTEYGTHWNFFFTLMAMDCFNYVSTLLCKGFEELVGFVILALHQTLLTVGGLSMYIQHAPRDTFFSMNREGILSLP
ncbi:Glucosaminyl phosphatidylinositol (GlcN-PI) nositol acylation protein, partial [Coelomomyces lativittatus]